jgi:hypothetical protein
LQAGGLKKQILFFSIYLFIFITLGAIILNKTLGGGIILINFGGHYFNNFFGGHYFNKNNLGGGAKNDLIINPGMIILLNFYFFGGKFKKII